MIGVSSIDSSTINLGERVGSLSELDSACGRFNFGFFRLGFGFVLYPWGWDFC